VDLIVKIAQIHRIDDKMSEIRVLDESDVMWFTQIFTNKFKWLREGQTVKIKNAYVNQTIHRTRFFSMSYASNILTLPCDSKLPRSMITN